MASFTVALQNSDEKLFLRGELVSVRENPWHAYLDWGGGTGYGGTWAMQSFSTLFTWSRDR